jgi:hypothetical protein
VTVSPLLGIIWLACAAIGYAIGNPKGRATEGIVLGLLLGVIGVIIVACLSPKKQPMPYGYAPGPMPNAMAPAPWAQPPAVPGALNAVGPHWASDPTGRHQHRWWSGTAWSDSVSDNGVSSLDPIQQG